MNSDSEGKLRKSVTCTVGRQVAFSGDNDVFISISQYFNAYIIGKRNHNHSSRRKDRQELKDLNKFLVF